MCIFFNYLSIQYWLFIIIFQNNFFYFNNYKYTKYLSLLLLKIQLQLLTYKYLQCRLLEFEDTKRYKANYPFYFHTYRYINNFRI
jgi:hypothetical protein